MLKRYRFWLWAAIIFMFLTAAAHTSSLFVGPSPRNETERQLFDLMANYRSDLGGGFRRSMRDIVTALSACLSLVYLLGGLTLAYLARKTNVSPGVLKGVMGIHLLIFGICFGLMVVFTFLPPIVLTGLVFFTLVISYFLFSKQEIGTA